VCLKRVTRMRHDNMTMLEGSKMGNGTGKAGEAREHAKECEGRWQPACGRKASSRFCMYRVTVA
jgi:hypothetical protein